MRPGGNQTFSSARPPNEELELASCQLGNTIYIYIIHYARVRQRAPQDCLPLQFIKAIRDPSSSPPGGQSQHYYPGHSPYLHPWYHNLWNSRRASGLFLLHPISSCYANVRLALPRTALTCGSIRTHTHTKEHTHAWNRRPMRTTPRRCHVETPPSKLNNGILLIIYIFGGGSHSHTHILVCVFSNSIHVRGSFTETCIIAVTHCVHG